MFLFLICLTAAYLIVFRYKLLKSTSTLNCGIAGYSGAQPASVSNGVIHRLSILLWKNLKRGRHSTGVHGSSLYKTTDSSDDFIADNKYVLAASGANNVIGHTRHATTAGPHKQEHAHPFEYENVVGTHNGWLVNTEVVSKKYDVENPYVDSELFFKVINKENNLDVIPDLIGNAALAFKYQGDLFLYRRENRPLHVVRFRDKESGNYGIFYSSEAHPLRCVSNNVVQNLRPHTLYRFRDGILVDVLDVEKPKHEFKSDWTSFTWKTQAPELAEELGVKKYTGSSYSQRNSHGSEHHSYGHGWQHFPPQGNNRQLPISGTSSQSGTTSGGQKRGSSREDKTESLLNELTKLYGGQRPSKHASEVVDNAEIESIIRKCSSANGIASALISVKDQDGLPVKGAYVFVEGDKHMSITNSEGNSYIEIGLDKSSRRIFFLSPKKTRAFWTKQINTTNLSGQVLEVTCILPFRPKEEKEKESSFLHSAVQDAIDAAQEGSKKKADVRNGNIERKVGKVQKDDDLQLYVSYSQQLGKRSLIIRHPLFEDLMQKNELMQAYLSSIDNSEQSHGEILELIEGISDDANSFIKGFDNLASKDSESIDDTYLEFLVELVAAIEELYNCFEQFEEAVVSSKEVPTDYSIKSLAVSVNNSIETISDIICSDTSKSVDINFLPF